MNELKLFSTNPPGAPIEAGQWEGILLRLNNNVALLNRSLVFGALCFDEDISDVTVSFWIHVFHQSKVERCSPREERCRQL